MKRFVIFFLLLYIPSVSYAKDDNKEQLATIQQNIKLKEKEIAKTKKKEAVVSKDINYIKYRISKTNKQIKRISKDLAYTKNKYNKAKRDLENTQKKMQDTKKALADQLVLLYKRKDLQQDYFNLFVQKLFDNTSFADEDKQYYAMKVLLKNNEYLYKTATRQEEEILKLQAILDDNKKKLERDEKRYKNKQDELEDLNDQKRRVLKGLTQKRKSAEAELDDLKKAAKELQQLINKFVQSSSSRGDRSNISQRYSKIRTSQGALAWPVKGNVITTFGKQKHPVLDTYLLSNGIEISSAQNTSVVAVKDGKIVFADKFSSYGNMVILDHGDGVYTVYAYLNSIKVSKNSSVVKNAVIGTVGYSPIRKTYSLYFEVRVDGIPVDPMLWLK